MACRHCIQDERRLAEAREQAGAVTIYRIEVLPKKAGRSFRFAMIAMALSCWLVFEVSATWMKVLAGLWAFVYFLYFFVPICRVYGMVTTKRSAT